MAVGAASSVTRAQDAPPAPTAPTTPTTPTTPAPAPTPTATPTSPTTTEAVAPTPADAPATPAAPATPVEVTAARVMPAEAAPPETERRVSIFLGAGGRYLGPDSWMAANYQLLGIGGAVVELKPRFGASASLSYGRSSGTIGYDEGVEVKASMLTVSAGVRGIFKTRKATSFIGAELGYVRGTLSRSTPDVMFEDSVGAPALVLVLGSYKPNNRTYLGFEARVTLASSAGERDVAMASIQFDILLGARVSGRSWLEPSAANTESRSAPPPATVIATPPPPPPPPTSASTTPTTTPPPTTSTPPTASTTAPPPATIGDALAALQPGQRVHIVRVAGDVLEGAVVSSNRTELRIQLKFQQITINASDIADLSTLPGDSHAP